MRSDGLDLLIALAIVAGAGDGFCEGIAHAISADQGIIDA